MTRNFMNINAPKQEVWKPIHEFLSSNLSLSAWDPNSKTNPSLIQTSWNIEIAASLMFPIASITKTSSPPSIKTNLSLEESLEINWETFDQMNRISTSSSNWNEKNLEEVGKWIAFFIVRRILSFQDENRNNFERLFKPKIGISLKLGMNDKQIIAKLITILL